MCVQGGEGMDLSSTSQSPVSSLNKIHFVKTYFSQWRKKKFHHLFYWVSEWVSDCCLTPTQQQFQQVNFQWDDDEVRFVLDQNPELEFFIVLAHWNNSLQIYMSLYSNTLSWFWVNQSLLFLLNAACLAEKQQMPIL